MATSTTYTSRTPKQPPPFDISKVGGNASPEIKARLGNMKAFLTTFVPERFKGVAFFGRHITDRFEVTEISVLRKAEEEEKWEGRVVLELDVEEDMINGGGNIHGGCSAFLVDMCSSLSLNALSLAQKGSLSPSVSQAINVIYHSPAGVGERLRIVNTSMTMGGRAHSARTEIWNATHHRLVASGTHVKMAPSPPPAAKL